MDRYLIRSSPASPSSITIGGFSAGDPPNGISELLRERGHGGLVNDMEVVESPYGPADEGLGD